MPDKPPAIAFKDPPTANAKDLVGDAYKASDDYGVASAEVRIQPANPAEAGEPSKRRRACDRGSRAADRAADPPAGHPKTIDDKQMFDLTAHPWAGMPMTVMLAATDDAGQTSLSAPQNFVLPERQFHDPLARAIIEQRRILAAAPRANH